MQLRYFIIKMHVHLRCASNFIKLICSMAKNKPNGLCIWSPILHQCYNIHLWGVKYPVDEIIPTIYYWFCKQFKIAVCANLFLLSLYIFLPLFLLFKFEISVSFYLQLDSHRMYLHLEPYHRLHCFQVARPHRHLVL